jgi:hypothetical protein
MSNQPQREPTDTSGDLDTKYRFFSTVRRGYRPGTDFTRGDPSDGSLTTEGETKIEYTAKVTKGPDSGTKKTKPVSLDMYGPGHVTGLDDRQVVRMEPEPGSTTFPPNYFPLVEFETPDIAWLFSPVDHDEMGRTYPWMTLVVVEKSTASLSRGGGGDGQRPNPVLEAPWKELPRIQDAWAWAHTQVVGSPAVKQEGNSDGDPLEEEFKRRSDITVCRLLCPRNLDPQTTYFAAVVPTFKAGRKVGLGNDPPDENTDNDTPSMELAWDPRPPPSGNGGDSDSTGDRSPVRLPVYYEWEFTTGKKGDFEYLVRQLEPRDLSSDQYQIGYREVDVTDPGPKPLDFDDGKVHTVKLGGALQAEKRDEWWWYERSGELRRLLNKPAEAVGEASEGYQIIGPPVYGQWHAQAIFRRRHEQNEGFLDLSPADGYDWTQLQAADDYEYEPESERPAPGEIERQYDGYGPMKPLLDPPPTVEGGVPGGKYDEWDLQWLYDLNLTPSFRIAASVGAGIVQDRQEALMAAAWEQVGDIREANRTLAAAQLSRAAMAPQIRRQKTASYPTEKLLQFTEPAHERLYVEELKTTAADHLDQSDVPASVLSPAFRRLTSSAGPLAKRLDSSTGLDSIVSGLFEGRLSTSVESRPDGMVSVGTGDRGLDALCHDVRNLPHERDDEPRRDDEPGGDDEPGHDDEDVPGSDVAYLELLFCTRSFDPPTSSPPDPAAIRRAWDPEGSFVDRVLERLDAPALRRRADPLDRVMAYPEFPQPTYRDLKSVSERYLLPGVDQVPNDTVGGLMTHRRFIEAFMTGMNHEMASELLWRRFPTDREGTYFKRFWDQRSRIPKPDSEAKLDDIIPIHRWDDKGPDNIGHSPLGSNVRTGDTGKPPDKRDSGSDISPTAVLLIRGELLRRYPTTNIYAAKAKRVDGDRVPQWAGASQRENPDPPDTDYQKFPIFKGNLEPDITFLGFDLTVDEALGKTKTQSVDQDDSDSDVEKDDEGWFFVLSEPVGESKFGLDVGQEGEKRPFGIKTRNAGPRTANQGQVNEGVEVGWAGLAWTHLPSADQPNRTYIDVENHTPGKEQWVVEEGIQWGPSSDDTFDADQAAEWGKNSAHQAYITWQPPVRVAIHADDILPGGAG